jgi:hypothetical protein
VMLFLGGSEEEYYLFNRPTHRSPATDDRGVTDNSLFLHDFPTLYYEPLAKVFQALRSDDRLAQLFDLARGELVIDAYDLVDLVISEVRFLCRRSSVITNLLPGQFIHKRGFLPRPQSFARPRRPSWPVANTRWV